MTSSILLMVVGVVGFVGGVLVGRWWGSRRHENALVADASEANEMRAEAAASIAARTERRLARVLARAEEQGRIVNDDVEDMFCISDSTARNYLRQLVQARKLRREGTGGGTYYVPIQADKK